MTMMKGHLAGSLGLGLGLMVAALASLGCAKYPSCKKDKDCRAEAGEHCVGGVCQNCKADADCVARTPAGQPPWTCNAYRCGPAGATDGAVVGSGGQEGDPCTQRIDCMEGLTCREGACAGCTADAECSPSTCNLDTGRCATSGACQTDEQCAMDEICDGGTCVFSGNLGDPDGGPCGLAAVYFGFDSDELTPKTQEELTATAACITQQGVTVYLEAHADDRGTEEYNILLTERRGTMVRSFLGEQGVPAELLQVIAKGSLEAKATDEPSRAKERRVAFIWPQ
jgi:peptidoglycan-associated lipoprotein